MINKLCVERLKGKLVVAGFALGIAPFISNAIVAGTPAVDTDSAWDVTAFGATGDGATLDTASIQAAIDHAAEEDGGTVYFPPGNYLSTRLEVRSDNLILELREGAVLQASPRLEEYANGDRRLLHVRGARNVHLRGPGTIDLNGQHFTREHRLNWRIIYFEECSEVSVADLTILRGSNWTLTFKLCDGVVVRDVRIDEGSIINSDGIGILSSRNVHIADCFVNTSDDAIVIKSRNSRRGSPTENVLIENCTVASSSNAIKIGTESVSDFRNITIRNIKVRKPTDGRRERPLSAISLITDDGGLIENVLIENVHAEEVSAAFFIRVQRRLRGPRERPGGIRNVVIDGLTVERQHTCSSIMGIPDYEGHEATVGPGIVLRNMDITSVVAGSSDDIDGYPGERERNYPDGIHFAPYPAYGMYVRHARGVEIGPRVRFRTAVDDPRPPVKVEDTAEVTYVE